MPEPFFTDLAYEHQAVNGDMPTVTGVTNLKRRLIRRWITRRGSFAFRPDYGASLPDYQNEPLTIDVQKQMFNQIREQALLDPGVESVKSIAFNIDQNDSSMTSINVKITPIDGTDIDFIFRPFSLNDEVL